MKWIPSTEDQPPMRYVKHISPTVFMKWMLPGKVALADRFRGRKVSHWALITHPE